MARSSDRKSRWQTMRQRNTNGQTGEFGEHLVAKILGCHVATFADVDMADAFNIDSGIRVEVKTRDNYHAFGIGLKQLDGYLNQANVPFQIIDTLYALVAYRSGKWIRNGDRKPHGFSKKTTTHSPLPKFRMKHERVNFVAEKTDVIYLLDIRMVKALQRVAPIKFNHFPGENRRKERTMEVNRTLLKHLFVTSHIEQMANELSIKPRGWVREQRTIKSMVMIDSHIHPVCCSLVSVLKRDTHERIAQTVRFRAPNES